MNLKYGDEYDTGHYRYFTDYDFYSPNGKKIIVGSTFILDISYFFIKNSEYLKSLKKDICTPRYNYDKEYFYNSKSFKNIHIICKLFPEYIKCCVVKFDDFKVYFKITTKFLPKEINSKIFFINKYEFTNYCKYLINNNIYPLTSVEKTGKKYISFGKTKKFRCEPIEDEKDMICLDVYCGHKNHHLGYSGKGLLSSAMRDMDDEQVTNYDDESYEIIKFHNIRLKNKYIESEKYWEDLWRNPHRKSWKENTKNRKQWDKKEM